MDEDSINGNNDSFKTVHLPKREVSNEIVRKYGKKYNIVVGNFFITVSQNISGVKS